MTTRQTSPTHRRLVVLGAGAIGAHLLAAANPETPRLAIDPDPAVRAGLIEQGIEALPPPDARVEPDDVVVIATSASVAARAARDLPPGTPVVCLANGLIPDLDRERVADLAYGVVEFAASCPAPGRAVCTKPGWLTLHAAPAARWLSGVLDPARQRTRLTAHIHDHRHAKLVLNSSLDTVAAVIGGGIGDVFASRPAFDAFRALLAEGLAVARAAGWRLPAVQGTTPRMMARIFAAPILNRIAARAAAKQARDIASTLSRELKRGTLGEAEYLGGAIIREGQRLGVATPAHDRAMHVLRVIAAEGRGGAPHRAGELIAAR